MSIILYLLLIIVGFIGIKKTKFPNFKDYSVIAVKFTLYIGNYILFLFGIFGLIVIIYKLYKE